MSKIKDIRLEPVENGYKISYTECKKRNEEDSFESYMHKPKELVYKSDEADKAIAEFVKLDKMSKSEKEEYKEEE